MATDQERALVVIADAYQKDLAARVKKAKATLGKELGEGDTKAVSFDLDGQTLPLGKFQKTQPTYEWKVTDPEGLLLWARKNMPSLVTTVEVLDSDAVDDLLEQVKRQNGAFTEEGELIEGITHGKMSSSYAKIIPDREQLPESLRILRMEGRLDDLVAQLHELES